ncbi:hypothetical protein NP493_3654g00004, partial [Ridgeia piscesae]
AAAHYEGIVRVLEEERDLYKQQLDVLKSHCCCVPQSYSSSCSNVEIERLQRERDDLQNLLAKFERHICETKGELAMTRQELLRSPRQTKASLQAQAMLRRLENEREDALTELRRVTTERDTLHERLQEQTEHALKDVQKKLSRKEEEFDQRQDDLVHLEKDMVTVENDNRWPGRDLSPASHHRLMDKEKDALQMWWTRRRTKRAARKRHIAEDSSSEELMEVSRAREVAFRENRPFQDDLSSMMKENQAPGSDVDLVVVDRA